MTGARLCVLGICCWRVSFRHRKLVSERRILKETCSLASRFAFQVGNMGNSQGGHRRGSKHVVTVLQSDGRVLEFPRSLRVADLLYDHPKHFVCHSSALVLLQQGKMLPLDGVLLRGEVYFLLPLPKSKPDYQSARGAEQQPREGAKPGGTMKFLITKQQLAKILAEGSIKVETRAPELSSSLPKSNVPKSTTPVRVLHRPSPSLVKRPVTWSPGLESISEVPVM